MAINITSYTVFIFFLDLKAFLMHITGKSVALKKSIQVEFVDGDDAHM